MADQASGLGQFRGAAPANDNCANATLLTVGTSCSPTNGTVDQATQSIAAVDCQTFVGNANDDVWYRFVATSPAVTILVQVNETFDAVIDLRSGACNGTNIACMDDFTAGGNETLPATGLIVGTTYRFRVYDYEAGYPTDPTFTVCVYGTPEPPPNDVCEGATIQDLNVPGSVTVSGDNTGATDTEDFGAASAWEAFTIDECADITISYCGTDPFFGNAFLNLMTDCSFSDWIPSNDFDVTTCGDENITIRYIGVPAGTYYYAVLMDGSAMGAYTIEFSAVACGTGGPANDLCSNVIPVDLEAGNVVEFSGTTIGATNTNDMVPGSTLDIGGDTVTVWHAFTTLECTDIAVSYCGTDPLPLTYWAFLSQDCPAGDDAFFFDGFNFTDCGDDNATLFYLNVPAGTYYLPVRGEPSTAGPYQVQVSATACANAGPYCDAGAVATQFEKISNVTVAGIDNASSSSLGYEDFTSITGNVLQGQSYPINIEVTGGFATDQGLVWIDFDQSDSFEPGELVFTGDGIGPYTGTIAVPAGAVVGQTRMRIRLHDTYDLNVDYQNTPNPTPCDTSTFGQVEDYTINVAPGAEPPVNDQCGDVSAEDLAVGSSLTFTGDNTGATMGGDYEPGSDLESSGLASVWHAFTTTECANVSVSYCGTDPAFLNAWIFLSTTCPATDDILPSASFNTDDCADGNVTMYYPNLPAGTYYLPVMNDPNVESLAVGPYTIEVAATGCLPGPSNDECTGAVNQDLAIGGSVTFTGDNTGATDSQGADTLGIAQVWETFTTTECANLELTYCGTEPAFGNAFLSLFIDCPFTDFIPSTSFDLTTCEDGNVTIFYTAVPAGQYYYAVMNDPDNSAVGPYTITVSATACLPGPPNDECAGAIPLDVNLTCEPTSGTVLNATQSLEAVLCNTFTGIANDDVWYSFVATGPNQTITVDGTDTLDAVIQLFEGGCGNLVDLDCADATLGGDVEEIVSTDLVEGTTYFVRVYDFYNGYPIEPTFDICITGDIGTSVAEGHEGGFTLRPNPAEDEVTITWNGANGSGRLDILDLAGRLVFSEQRTLTAGGSLTLDLPAAISAGLYTVRLTTADLRSEQRLLVK